MEGLDMDNILSPDEVESLFTSDGSEETQVTPPEQQEEENKEKPTTEVPEVNPDELFTEEPESVGSEKVDTQGKEDTTSKEETGTSPKTNFYSSIASALKEEGILSALDEETLSKIQTPEDFAEAMENELKAKLDERQKRIDEALQVGVEPDEVRKYEGTINYLNTITEDAISDESANGEKLRKQLIFQDFLNRGFSKERAQRETQKSFNSGSDVEDAKEALASNKEYFQQEYEDFRVSSPLLPIINAEQLCLASQYFFFISSIKATASSSFSHLRIVAMKRDFFSTISPSPPDNNTL